MNEDCHIAGHRFVINTEVSGDTISFENRCARCGEQGPMPEEWVRDRMEWEKNREPLPDLSGLCAH